MAESHDGGGHHADWLGGMIAVTRYAGGKGAIRSAWWMTPIGFAAGVLVAYLIWLGGSVVDPLLTGAGVAFLVVFSAPYVHFWASNSIRDGRGLKLTTGDAHRGPDDTASRPIDGRT